VYSSGYEGEVRWESTVGFLGSRCGVSSAGESTCDEGGNGVDYYETGIGRGKSGSCVGEEGDHVGEGGCGEVGEILEEV